MPFIELRKIVSKAYAQHQQGVTSRSYFVSFSRDRGTGAKVHTLHTTREFDRISRTSNQRGKEDGVEGEWLPWLPWVDVEEQKLYEALVQPLSWWLQGLHRFRSFDASYSPCRH